MWWEIFMTIFGFMILVVVGAFAADSYNSYRKSKDELRRAWRRAYEGWAILTCFILFDWLIRIIKWIYIVDFIEVTRNPNRQNSKKIRRPE